MRSVVEEDELKKKLKERKWKPDHYLEMDDWISPHTCIKYSFEKAIQIEDLIILNKE